MAKDLDAFRGRGLLSQQIQTFAVAQGNNLWCGMWDILEHPPQVIHLWC